MTQEEKRQLLLADLCGRLPYGVQGFYKTSGIEITSQKMTYDIIGNLEYKNNVEFKPYLFPMSSITEEQRSEYEELYTKYNYLYGVDGKYMVQTWKVDWCNKNHFDFRGLIPLDLAIDATGLNIY